jgi:hypothetical protein
VLVRCGRCRRVLCRALPANGGRPVVLADVRPYARLEVGTAAGPADRVHLRCHARCGSRWTRRLDRGALAAAVHRGGGELLLGVDA